MAEAGNSKHRQKARQRKRKMMILFMQNTVKRFYPRYGSGNRNLWLQMYIISFFVPLLASYRLSTGFFCGNAFKIKIKEKQ